MSDTFTAPGGTQFICSRDGLKVWAKADDDGRPGVLLADLLAFADRAAWVPCAERMPSDGARVLLATARGALRIVRRDGASFYDRAEMLWYDGDGAHWRELPAAPEEGR